VVEPEVETAPSCSPINDFKVKELDIPQLKSRLPAKSIHQQGSFFIIII
jgi:hypothetical protein